MDVLRLDTCVAMEEIPPCQEACPAGVNIRGFLYLLKQGKLNEAIQVIRESLPLPAVTGRICFHPCESGCARKEVDESVSIKYLERFVADYTLEQKAKPIRRVHVEKVAIVGSGPAGIAAAYFLTKMGYRVSVFESMSVLGGMLRVGIPEYRLPRDVLDVQVNYIRDTGVEFQTGITIGKDMTIEELKDKGYKAIFIAVGTHRSLKLDTPGEEMQGVYYGLDFLRDVNIGKRVKVGEKVAIVGGGNVAIDSARTARRLGARKVLVIYRRSRQEMPVYEKEVEAAESEGVKISYLTAPIRILSKDGKVDGMECIEMELGKPDASGRRSPIPVKGSEFMINADMIVPAVGEAPDFSFWTDKDKFSVTSAGKLKADARNLTTDIPGVFAGGDAVNGPTSVVEAIASGKRAAISIDCYLKGAELETRKEKEVKGVKEPPKEGVEERARQVTPLLSVKQRSKNFREVKSGFSEEMATNEAQRCMACGSKAYIAYPDDCQLCYQCELECPKEAVKVDFTPVKRPPVIEYRERD